MGKCPFGFEESLKTRSPNVFGRWLEAEKHSGEETDEKSADGEDLDEIDA